MHIAEPRSVSQSWLRLAGDDLAAVDSCSAGLHLHQSDCKPLAISPVDGYPRSGCAAAFDAAKYNGTAWYVSMGPILIRPPKGDVHTPKWT